MKNKLLINSALTALFLVPNFAFASLFWNINTGINELKGNNFQFAKDYFLSYTKNNPNDKDGYYWLAKAYLSNNNDETSIKLARENFKKSYELTAKEKNIEKINLEINDTANIEDYFDMAGMYFEAGNIKEADFYADMMLQINPKSPSAYFIKAKIAYLRKDEENAREYLNKAITFNNNLLNTNLAKNLNILDIPELTKEMYAQFALEAYFKGDIDSSVKYLNKYIIKDPLNTDVLNMLCDLYIKKGDIENAQRIIDEVLKINENDIQALLYRTKIYELNNDERFLPSLLELYKLNPNNKDTLYALGNYYLSLKDYENAKKYFEILTGVDDEYYEGYFGYILSLIETLKTDEAQNLIRKASELNPNASEVQYLLARICENQASYKEAYDYINEALKKDKNPVYYLEKAKINYIFQKYEESVKNLDDARNLGYKTIYDDEINELYVKNYIKLQDVESTQKYINTLKDLDKNKLIYKYNLYILYKLQGEDKKAQTQLLQLKKSKSNEISDTVDLSEIVYELKDIDSAISVLDTAIKKHPKEPKLYMQKLKLYYMADDKDKIKETLDIIKENIR